MVVAAAVVAVTIMRAPCHGIGHAGGGAWRSCRRGRQHNRQVAPGPRHCTSATRCSSQLPTGDSDMWHPLLVTISKGWASL